jgi:hypothetical protein
MWGEGGADMRSVANVKERQEKERQERRETEKKKSGRQNKENYRKAMALGGYMDWMRLQINQQTLRWCCLGDEVNSSNFLPRGPPFGLACQWQLFLPSVQST